MKLELPFRAACLGRGAECALQPSDSPLAGFRVYIGHVMQKPLGEHAGRLQGSQKLLQAEALGVHDGQLQAVSHDLLGAVGGQQQRVEARMRGWQFLRVWSIPLQHTPACTGRRSALSRASGCG